MEGCPRGVPLERRAVRYSDLLIPTLREPPAEAEVPSHQLLLRGGLIRKVAAGVYSFLPLAVRILHKIESIIREEMVRAGAQEVLLPLVTPAELWQESGRWGAYGKELLKFQDRHDRWFCLGPTHEEVMTDLFRSNVRSYRQLPLNLFQIQIKFRDEIRPRFGLLRGREFIMKDGYSFHLDEESAQGTYRRMLEAYRTIFSRCGLRCSPVEADTGSIGGSLSHEFVVDAESGEDWIARCGACDYAANVELAQPRISGADGGGAAPLPPGAPLKVDTPGKKSVEEVSAFLRVAPRQVLKTLFYRTPQGLVAALLRGDHEISEPKLNRVLGGGGVELADPAEVERASGVPPGFVGPVGLSGVPAYADHALAQGGPWVTGANAPDAHLTGVVISRDLPALRWADLRRVVDGDGCPRCNGTLTLHRGIEVGQIFYLGRKYSESLKATVLDEAGKARVVVMGCYGIGVSRTMAAAIEQHHDASGPRWPLAIAPFHVEVLSMNPKEAPLQTLSVELAQRLEAAGLEVLLDDRVERPGVKFNDADLLGLPLRLVVGNRFKKEGNVEVQTRGEAAVEALTPDEAVPSLVGRVRSALGQGSSR